MTEHKLDCHAHIRPPEPDEVPPVLHMRNRDLVKYRARLLCYDAMSARVGGGVPTFQHWCHGLDAMEDYLRIWDRRRTAADDVR